MRRLEVSWYCGAIPIRIGEIAENAQGTAFEWDKQFLSNKIELSPITFKKMLGVILIPKEPFDGLPGFIADHLPDGWGRLLLRQKLIRSGTTQDDVSPLDYLATLGTRAMGALAFRPALKNADAWKKGALDLEKLQSGVEPILAGTASRVLEEFLSGGASPNGMRPKIIAKQYKQRWSVGDEKLDAPEWIVKFRAPGDCIDSGKIEYIYSILAKNAGLNVPESQLIETKKDAFFASKRFDREPGGCRLHMHTLSGILQTSPLNNTIGYDHLAKVAVALTNNRALLEEVFRLTAFNVVSVNQDDHSRNVAFTMTHNGEWNLAPAYDLTFHQNRNGEQKMGIGNKGRLTTDDLKDFANDLGLRTAITGNILDQVLDSISNFKELAHQYEVSQTEVKRISAAHLINLKNTTIKTQKPKEISKDSEISVSKRKRKNPIK